MVLASRPAQLEHIDISVGDMSPLCVGRHYKPVLNFCWNQGWLRTDIPQTTAAGHLNLVLSDALSESEAASRIITLLVAA